jgi:predicted O-methyltransferase YrrM
MNKQFTTDWFSHNIPNWTYILEPFKDKPNLNFLEIGVYEGRSTIWLLENVLTDSTSKITCIDLFNGELEENDMTNDSTLNLKYEEYFDYNILPFKDKVTKYKGWSSSILRKYPEEAIFDFAYIDASHTAYGTLEDAVLTHPLIKPGGIIIFDDYLWKDPNRTSPTDSPELGIDCFYNTYADFYEVIFNGYQVGLLKKK